jgi:hypothetical protein
MEQTTVLKPRSDLRVRMVDGEAVLLDRSRNRIHQLNETARFIFSKIDGERSYEDVVELVRAEFDVDAEVAERDVRAFLGLLRAEQLVEGDASPGATSAA